MLLYKLLFPLYSGLAEIVQETLMILIAGSKTAKPKEDCISPQISSPKEVKKEVKILLEKFREKGWETNSQMELLKSSKSAKWEV